MGSEPCKSTPRLDHTARTCKQDSESQTIACLLTSIVGDVAKHSGRKHAS